MVSPSFMGIPVELRLHIYEFLLASKYEGHPVFTCAKSEYWLQRGKRHLQRLGPAHIRTPILFTSKQVFAEALPVFFKVNTFEWTNNFFAKQLFGKNFDLIQRVKLRPLVTRCDFSVLPASCRTLEVSFESESAEILWDCRGRCGLSPNCLEMVKKLKRDGLKQLIITHVYDVKILRELEQAFEEAGGPKTLDH
ncbi:MAG: hypothetical protein M1830_000278 [Pleopsidium flavum]|nr:MAG: hypothetical protein M1830_000278 [Pleopsidium flavum]